MCHHPPSFQAQSAWPVLIVKGVPGVMGNYGNTSCDVPGPGAPAMNGPLERRPHNTKVKLPPGRCAGSIPSVFSTLSLFLMNIHPYPLKRVQSTLAQTSGAMNFRPLNYRLNPGGDAAYGVNPPRFQAQSTSGLLIID